MDQQGKNTTTDHFSLLMDNSPAAIQIHSTDGLLQRANKAWEVLWGMKAGDVVGKFNILEDNQARELGISQLVGRALAGESITIVDFVFDPVKSGYPGRKHWTRSRVFPLCDEHTNISSIIITHEDITAYKESEERYQIIVENAHEAILVVQNGLLKFFNQKALAICGYTRKDDYAGKSFVDFVHPDYRLMIAERHRQRVAGEEVPNFYQIKVLHKKGYSIWLQLNVIRTDWEGTAASLAFIYDITDYKQKEEELDAYRHRLQEIVGRQTNDLRNTHSYLQSIIDGTAESIVVIDTEHHVKLMNKTAIQLLNKGNKPTMELRCYQLHHHHNEPCSELDHPCPLRTILECKKPGTAIHTHTDKDGNDHTIEFLASPIFDKNGAISGIIEVGRDITERIEIEKSHKELQLRLFEQQKGESIANLASGIAHEFNNTLTSVMGGAELLQRKMDPHDKNIKYTKMILQSVQRMSNLTRQLLAYAKGGKYEPDILKLNSIVKESLALSHMGTGAGLQSELKLTEELWPVLADSRQIGQMLVNLFTNAFEAMVDTGGCLTARTSNIVKKEPWEDLFHAKQPAGDYVCISISDTGVGISDEAKKRLFEPFFTTKFLGRGLGLAAVAGITLNHGGALLLESTPGRGTTFHVFLHRTEKNEETTAVAHTDISRTAGKILLVDDEPQIIQILKTLLASQGYEVITAGSGFEALQQMKNHKNEIRLVILDVKMPDLHGSETFKLLKAMSPPLAIIVASGYDEDIALANIYLDPQDEFMQKPFHMERLFDKLEEIIRK
jgi:PAS domain S-box-containing protein